MSGCGGDDWTFVSKKKGGRRATHNHSAPRRVYRSVTKEEVIRQIEEEVDRLQKSSFYAHLCGVFREHLPRLLNIGASTDDDSDSDYDFSELQGSASEAKSSQPVDDASSPDDARSLDVIIYGLGSFCSPSVLSRCSVSQFALILLLTGISESKTSRAPKHHAVLQSKAHIRKVYAYDPVFIETDHTVLSAYGISIIKSNESCKRVVDRNSLFYMPHCDGELVENLVGANWSAKRLSHVSVLGNSFKKIVPDHLMESEEPATNSRRRYKHSCEHKHLRRVSRLCAESACIDDHNSTGIFNNMSLHTFSEQDLESLGEAFWAED